MKTKEEMTARYKVLYDTMVESKEPKNMHIFGDAEKWVFKELVAAHPEIAENWLSHLEAVCWDNYLSEREAMNIGKRIINQDGTKGFHWPHEAFVKAIETFGGTLEDKPHYNSFALYVTTNMEYSDHARSISEDMGYKTPNEVPNERMFKSCYAKALERLNDIDGGFAVREYFKQKMYDNSTS